MSRLNSSNGCSKKKYRDRENMFCLEGVRLVEEALPTGLVQSVFFSEQLFSSPRGGTALLGKVQKLGLAHRQCGVEIFNEITDTVSSQGGVIAVAAKPSWPAVSLGGTLLVADEIQDPGNMGT